MVGDDARAARWMMRGANARSTHPVLIPLQRPLAGDLALARPEAVAVPAGDVARAEAAVVPATEAEGLARYALSIRLKMKKLSVSDALGRN
jgi:hypothetical protein